MAVNTSRKATWGTLGPGAAVVKEEVGHGAMSLSVRALTFCMISEHTSGSKDPALARGQRAVSEGQARKGQIHPPPQPVVQRNQVPPWALPA